MPQVAPFFLVRWPPNLIISDTFKEISGPDSDSKLAPNIGSYALCVVPGSSSAEDARAKELEASAPVHLPFQQFQARDLPLDLALTPSHG